MNRHPICGCPALIVNPPDLGMGDRVAAGCGTGMAALPFPVDPSGRFSRVLTASGDSRQLTSLACEPAAGCGCDAGCFCGGHDGEVYAGYVNWALNQTERELARLQELLRYPIPGIWMGPAYVHMPSGNLVFQLAMPASGPLDAVVVQTYNAQAAGSEGGFGFGVSDLFNASVEDLGHGIANIITGTGKYLEYDDVAPEQWGMAPNSARNALKQLYDGTWIERQPDGLEWEYSEGGWLQRLRSPSGDIWTVVRDDDCRVVAIAAPNGRRTTYLYDGDEFAGVQDAAGRTTTGSIGGGSIQFPDGGSVQIDYGDGNLISAITDPAGHTTEYEYDHQSRVRRITDADGGEYAYVYRQEEDGYETRHWIKVTDPAGYITTVIHDCEVVRAVIDPLGHRTTYIWEEGSDPKVLEVIDPNGHSTGLSYTTLPTGVRALSGITRPEVGSFSFGYGENARCSSITDYDGHSTAIKWDADENRIEVLDAESGRFTFLYNDHRQIRGTIDPLTHRSTTVYNAAGDAFRVLNELGEITTLAYDNAGDATAVENPLNEVTSYTRDGVGRILTVMDPLERTTTYSYTPDGQLASVTNPESETNAYQYNGRHQLTRHTDPLGHSTTYVYDSRGNLTAETNPESETTELVYDEASRRIASINPLGFRSTFTYDAVGNQLTAQNPELETTQFRYDDADRVQATIDPLGHRTTYTYNGADLLLSRKNAENETSSWVYDYLYRNTVVNDPLGHFVSMEYDPLGRMVKFTDGEGGETRTVYDPAGRAIATINPLGHRFTTVYDVAGRPRRTISALQHVSTTVYDAGGRLVASINPLDEKTTYVYDDADRQVEVINPKGESTQTEYDAAGRVIATTDPLDHTTSFKYDDANRQTRVTNPMGEKTTTVYDDAGRVTASINPLGKQTTFEYDKADREIRRTNPENESVETFYDDAGRVIATNTPRGKTTDYEYDKANRVVRVIDPDSGVTTTVYDDAGRIEATIDPLGRTTLYDYDDADRPTAVTNPMGETTTKVYDPAGQVIATIDPLGNQTTYEYDKDGRQIEIANPELERTTMFYDDADRLVAVNDPLGHTTDYGYDQAGRQIRVWDFENRITTTVYDAAGRTIAVVNPLGRRFTSVYDNADRLTQQTNPLLQSVVFTYDAAGRRTRRIDARGNRTTYVYDDADRITQRRYPDGTRTTWVYDADGNPLQIASGYGTFTRTYDNLGRVSQMVAPTGDVVTWTYDAASQRRTLIDPDGGVTTYVYDAASRLETLVSPHGEQTDFQYDAAGREIQKRLDNGTWTSMVYDDAGRVTQIVSRDSSNDVQTSFAYEYDPAGRKTSVVEASGDRVTWTYDDANQLLSEHRSGVNLFRTTWTYDAAGNRKTEDDGTAVTTYEYDLANRLEYKDDGVQRTTYTYDADGNRRTVEEPSGDVTTSLWSYENQQVGVELPDGDVVTYVYAPATVDSVELRVAMVTDVGVVHALWDGQNLLRETDDLGSVEAEYTLAPQPFGNLVSQHRDADSSFYQFDGQGSTAALTDDTEAVTDSYFYHTFGKVRAQSGTTETPFQWLGMLGYYYDAVTDESSVRQRQYDPENGAFTSQDPLQSDANLYRYVGNNPGNASDPSGLDGFGHHFFPQELIRKFIDLFDDDAITLGYGFYSGETKPIHRGSHPKYTEAVEREFDAFLKRRPSGSGKIGRSEFRQFVDALLPDANDLGAGKDLKFIRGFNTRIALERSAAAGKSIDFRKYFAELSDEVLSRQGVRNLVTQRYWGMLSKKPDQPGRPSQRFAKLEPSLFRRLTSIGGTFLIMGGVSYGYEQAYLGDLGDKAKHSAEAAGVYHAIKLARQQGRFPDIASTPFPSDAELKKGVEVDLVVAGSLNRALDRQAEADIRTYRDYSRLILHLVPITNETGTVVQHRLRVQQVLPPEAQGAGGPTIRTIVDPFKPLGGIGRPFPVIEGVW